MFYIASLFYPARFKRLIASLKKEGTFRREPLRELDRNIYVISLPLVFLCLLFFLIEGYLRIDLLALVILLWVVLSAFSVRYIIKKIIIPCTVGRLKPVFLEEEPEYFPVLMSVWGWSFRYSAYDESGNLGSSYKSPHIPKNIFNKEEFLSLPVEAFFDPENPKNNCPKVLGLIEKFRMTTDSVFEGEI